MADVENTLIIENIKEEVPGVKIFTFATDPAHPVVYKAGQYLTLIYPFDKDTRRSYSITSAPALHEPLAVGVKRIDNGLFSRFLIDNAKPGDVLETTGAAGFFTLPDNIALYKQVFLLAAGSGITPLYSLVKELLASYQHLSVVLIYSNRSAAETIFLAELKELANRYIGRFEIEFLFSDNPNLFKARLYRDLLVQLVLKYQNCSPEQILAYICGPQEYMRMCTYGLHAAKLPDKNIKKEIFNTNLAVPRVLPPNTEAHRVKLKWRQEEISLQVQYPTTILQAAKKAGLRLPFSCEAGYCGNCVAQCTVGNVWMARNEVLTEKDIARGLVLTCVGYPVNEVSLNI